MKNLSIHIAGRIIGPEHPSFIVAEVSGNHNQRFETAVRIIKAAAKTGVDAIKLQTYTPDTITIDSRKKWFLVGGKENPDAWKGKTLYELYQKAYTPWEWQPQLKKLTETLGMIFFSTPFDPTAVDFLERMAVPCYKIASYEVTNIPLLAKVARTKKPVIMSVGFASVAEITLALATLRKHGAKDIALLHCVTAYSAKPPLESMNLRTIPDIQKRFRVVSGFSDNNAGIDAPLIAVAMGASIIEKHVILKRRNGGPDAQFSLEMEEVKTMVELIRKAEKAMGIVHYGPASKAEEYNKRFRPSLFVVQDVKKGGAFTHENVRPIRPANGLPPKFLDNVIGKRARNDIERGTPLSWNLVT